VFGLACNLGAALFVDDKLGRTEKNRKLRARQTRNLLAALGPTFIKVILPRFVLCSAGSRSCMAWDALTQKSGRFLYVQAGQALSIRVDLLPKEYITELRQLQDNVPAFDTGSAIEPSAKAAPSIEILNNGVAVDGR
jgi:predicted unusual protein kinase regulating ubiquinone biosynthesis (AarF/ABC1/UbiB family)